MIENVEIKFGSFIKTKFVLGFYSFFYEIIKIFEDVQLLPFLARVDNLKVANWSGMLEFSVFKQFDKSQMFF